MATQQKCMTSRIGSFSPHLLDCLFYMPWYCLRCWFSPPFFMCRLPENFPPIEWIDISSSFQLFWFSLLSVCFDSVLFHKILLSWQAFRPFLYKGVFPCCYVQWHAFRPFFPEPCESLDVGMARASFWGTANWQSVSPRAVLRRYLCFPQLHATIDWTFRRF